MQPTISRQGHLSYVRHPFDTDVWRLELRRGRPTENATRLISSTRGDYMARYSPDGRRIAFASFRTGSHEIWVCDSDGSNVVQLTSFGGMDYTADPRWSPDGRLIAFISYPEGKRAAYVISSEGGEPKRLEIDKTDGWSRDGKSIYFSSKRAGADQLWKMPSGGGAAIQVTKNGYSRGVFEALDGRFLYYLKWEASDDNSLWRVPTEGGNESRVLRSVLHDNFAVVTNGIYFTATAEPRSIQFLDFASGKAIPVARIHEPLSGYSVSPDERWLIFTRVEDRSSDLMLVANFHPPEAARR